MICKKVTKKAYLENDSIYPFQRIEVLKSVDNIFYTLRFKSYVQYYGVYDNDRLVLFAPIRKYFGKNECEILGTTEYFDIVDCIYYENNTKILKEAYNCLFEHLKSKGFARIKWDWLPEDTQTKNVLEGLENDGKIKFLNEPIYNVKIDLANFDTFEEYFKTLSKSVRQNIRTAYNRMARDNVNYNLNCIADSCAGGGRSQIKKQKVVKAISKGTEAEIWTSRY